MGHSIPTPPTEEHGLKPSRKTSSGKAGKASHRASKRIGGTSIISAASSQSEPHSPTSDGRHKRVWKACERCRMKKTKVGLSVSYLSLFSALLLTHTSAMASSPVRGVRTTA